MIDPCLWKHEPFSTKVQSSNRPDKTSRSPAMKMQHAAIVIHPPKIAGVPAQLCPAQSRNRAIRRCGGGRYRGDGCKTMTSRALLGAEPNADSDLRADIDRGLSVRMHH